MRTSQRRIIVYVLAVALVVTTVAYAVMQTTLNVSGVVVKKGATLDIYFDNLQTPILTGNGKSNSTNLSSTTFNFSIELSEPNDSVKYYLDIVNDDEVNAKLEDVVIEGANDLVSRNIELIFTYADDKPVQAGDYLPAGTRKNLKVHILYSNVDSIYSDDANLSLNIKLVYTQYDGDIPSGDGGGTSNNTIVYCNHSCASTGGTCSKDDMITDTGIRCAVPLQSSATWGEDLPSSMFSENGIAKQYFYVINDDGTNLTLISEGRIHATGDEYYSTGHCGGTYCSSGYPSTLVSGLNSVSSELTLLPEFTYDLSDQSAGNDEVFTNYNKSITAKVRLPKVSDFTKLFNTNIESLLNGIDLPAWASANDSYYYEAYWLSSVYSMATTYSEIGNYVNLIVSGSKLTTGNSYLDTTTKHAVRGVIVIPKTSVAIN